MSAASMTKGLALAEGLQIQPGKDKSSRTEIDAGAPTCSKPELSLRHVLNRSSYARAWIPPHLIDSLEIR